MYIHLFKPIRKLSFCPRRSQINALRRRWRNASINTCTILSAFVLIIYAQLIILQKGRQSFDLFFQCLKKLNGILIWLITLKYQIFLNYHFCQLFLINISITYILTSITITITIIIASNDVNLLGGKSISTSCWIIIPSRWFWRRIVQFADALTNIISNSRIYSLWCLY